MLMNAGSRSAQGTRGPSVRGSHGLRGPWMMMVASLLLALFSAQARADVILEAQGIFWVDGGLVIMTGIPAKGLESNASYGKFIRDGVMHHFPSATGIQYFPDNYGSAVTTRYAYTVDRWSTWEFRAKPKPRDLELERLQSEAAARHRELDKVLKKAKPVLNPDHKRSPEELIRRYGEYVKSRDSQYAKWKKSGKDKSSLDYAVYNAFAVEVKKQTPWIQKVKAALAAKERAYAALREYENSKKQ